MESQELRRINDEEVKEDTFERESKTNDDDENESSSDDDSEKEDYSSLDHKMRNQMRISKKDKRAVKNGNKTLMTYENYDKYVNHHYRRNARLLREEARKRGILLYNPDGSPPYDFNQCPICCLNNSRKPIYKKRAQAETDNRNNEVLYQVHVDISSRKVLSKNGNQYYAAFTDKGGKLVYPVPIKNRSKISIEYSIMKYLVNILEKANESRPKGEQLTIKIFIADGEKAFSSKAIENYLLKKGIRLKVVPPDHGDLNALVESKIFDLDCLIEKYLKNSNLYHGNYLHLWEYALEFAALILNTRLYKKLKWKSPYFMVFGEDFDLDLISQFGTLASVYIPKSRRDPKISFGSRYKDNMIYLGPCPQGRPEGLVARFYCPETDEVWRSMDYTLFKDQFRKTTIYDVPSNVVQDNDESEDYSPSDGELEDGDFSVNFLTNHNCDVDFTSLEGVTCNVAYHSDKPFEKSVTSYVSYEDLNDSVNLCNLYGKQGPFDDEIKIEDPISQADKLMDSNGDGHIKSLNSVFEGVTKELVPEDPNSKEEVKKEVLDFEPPVPPDPSENIYLDPSIFKMDGKLPFDDYFAYNSEQLHDMAGKLINRSKINCSRDEIKVIEAIIKHGVETDNERMIVDMFNLFSVENMKGVSIPKFFKDIADNPEKEHWIEAVKVELKQLIKNGTWEYVRLPAGKTLVDSRWVFVKKFNPDGSIRRFKARFVAKGYSQVYGENYFDTYAPVIGMISLRMVLALATARGWDVMQLDVETAFLNSPVEEEIYVKPPEGLDLIGHNLEKGYVLKLNKSLYGIKQAPYNWAKMLNAVLVELGLTQSKYDACLYTYVDSKGERCYVTIYVDDIVITGSAKSKIDEIRKTLAEKFIVNDVGAEVSLLLGLIVEFDSTTGTRKLHQRLFTEKIIQSYSLKQGKEESKIPADPSLYENFVKELESKKEPVLSSYPYREAIGSLLYLAVMTRPAFQKFCDRLVH